MWAVLWGVCVLCAADTSLRIVVSTASHRLTVISGEADTLLHVPVAVGSGRSMSYGAQRWRFDTPRGVYTVIKKEADPVWVPPDWHYVEVARREHLKLVWLHGDTTIDLHDGSTLIVKNLRVRVEDDSTYDEFDGDYDLVSGRTLYVPPLGSPARRVHGELGPYRLLLDGGIGIHGTPYTSTVGTAATHGCLRLYDRDIQWLYEHVPIGTRVYIH